MFQKKLKYLLEDVETNIFRIQDYSSIMVGYSSILFIDFMFKAKTLNGFTNLFSPYDFKKNDETVLKHFKSLS